MRETTIQEYDGNTYPPLMCRVQSPGTRNPHRCLQRAPEPIVQSTTLFTLLLLLFADGKLWFSAILFLIFLVEYGQGALVLEFRFNHTHKKG